LNVVSAGLVSATAKPGRVIWRASKPTIVPVGEASCAGGEDAASLTIRELRVGEEELYIDLDHDAPAEQPILVRAQRPTIHIAVDGCPHGQLVADEEVAARTTDATTASVPLDRLPDGDLTLTIEVLGTTTSTHLRKVARDIESISSMQRKLVVHVPVDGGRNTEALVRVPDCLGVTGQEVER